MRLIDADELEVVVFTDNDGTFADGVQWLLEKIDSMPSIQQWIPCGEAPPPKNKWIMATVVHEDEDKVCRYSDLVWINDDSQLEHITAWMLLPEPYMEDTTMEKNEK